MTSARHVSPGCQPHWRLVSIVLLVFTLGSAWAFAANPAPADPDFPAYVAKHQGDLQPVFAQHGCDMLKEGLPILISVMGDILLATALIGWVLDVPLMWGFSTIFAPAYAKFTRALIYACGRLVLALMMTVILSFAALVGVNAGAGLPALVVVGVLTAPAIIVQLFWIGYLYRTPPRTSFLFYIALLFVHAILCAILVPTLFLRQVDTAFAEFMERSVAPVLQDAADHAQKDAATLAAKRDDEQARATALQAQITQAQSDEQDLRKTLEARRNSPALLFSHLVMLRAQGDLADAGTGLADFIAKNPDDPHANAARGQLEAVNQALSAQLALQRQQLADDARAKARAKTQLLAKAAAGDATLSEMRSELLGKTRSEVISYFGAPSETGADRFGYGRRMLLDPDTHEHRGLTVVFSEGLVQGVDYYYGDPQ